MSMYVERESGTAVSDACNSQAVGTHPAGAPVVKFTPGLLNKHLRNAARVTRPRPAEYADQYEWYAAFVAKHGMTLPPDDDEHRQLREWVKFKQQQHAKGKIPPRVAEQLAQHGLDFSQYSARNTGRGEREDDGKYIAMMRAHLLQHGSYDLPAGADAGLLLWQSKLLERFFTNGRSARMCQIQDQLPGLHFGMWRTPSDCQARDPAWWAMATKFREASIRFPAYRGVLHSGTPSELAHWARTQQAVAAKGRAAMPRCQRGELYDLEVIERDQYRVNVNRERVRDALGVKPRLPPASRLLTTFLGASTVVRFMGLQRSPQQHCVQFGLLPEHAAALISATAHEREIVTRWSGYVVPKLLADAKRLEALRAGFFQPDQLHAVVADPASRPAILTEDVLLMGLTVEAVRRKCELLALPQMVES